MVNLAEKHDDDGSVQLADGEISRILTALQRAEFKRSESGNVRPDQTFKPRSLMEIAETARQQDEAAKAVEVAIAHKTPEDTKDQPDQINLDDDQHSADLARASDTVDPTMREVATLPDESTGNTGGAAVGKVEQASAGASNATSLGTHQPHEEVPSGGDGLPQADLGLGADAEHESGADDVAPISPFETAQAAYDRGYGDGVAAGRGAAEAELRSNIEAEFETKLSNKINAFETALTALVKPQSVDTSDLSASLQAAVVRLAAARAGAAIDQLPGLMVTRIENLADAAGKNVSAGHVFMHPEDCAVIAPIMETRQDQFKIEPDPGLCRGDIRIKFDGMEISDVADLRADWQISQSMAPKNSVEVEMTRAEISDVELETPDANNLGLDSQKTSVQSKVDSSSLGDDENGKPMIDDDEDSEEAASSEAIGLMPLTTTGGDDSASEGGAEDSEEASSEAIGLMPLTTTGGDDSASEGGAGDNEEASSSEATGLMPLTSKNIEE